MARLAKWDPFRELLDIKDDFDRMIDRLFKSEFSLWEGRGAPPVDIYEDEDNIIVKAEVPGISKENLSVTLSDDTLTISAKDVKEKEIKKENYYRKEIRRGGFTRSFTLPCAVDRNKVKATMKDGILEIVLPKAEEAKEKEIKIDIE